MTREEELKAIYKTQGQRLEPGYYCKNCGNRTPSESDGGYWFCAQCGEMVAIAN